MLSEEIRQKFLKFFEEKGHKIISSSSLLSNDPTVLFTTAGMQQFKKYFLGEKSPFGNKVASCQKCLRTSDIEEVGDISHLTFLEMLGNFSFGNYFKKEAIKLAFVFLTEICNLDKDKLWFTIFKGDKRALKDEESGKIWQKLGIDEKKIYGFDRKDNFWGPTGQEGPCGPTTEIHYDLTRVPCSKGNDCLPNCECGRFIEIWNLVFNEYYQDEKGEFSLLKQKGVDTGMGFERLVMILENKTSFYETDLFWPLIQLIEKASCKKYSEDKKHFRILADHLRASVFLITDKVLPNNLGQGYILRRLLRKIQRISINLKLEENWEVPAVKWIINKYQEIYPELRGKENEISIVIQKEKEKFEKTLTEGLRYFEKLIKKKIQDNQSKIISGEEAFLLYESYGFPLEMVRELAQERNFKVIDIDFKNLFKEHKEISKAGAKKKFGGVGISQLKSEEDKQKAERLHTATHLLHSALRKVLSEKVQQMGSDINPERLRFDFSFERKMSPEEIKKVELLVNQKIKEDLEIKREEMFLKDALQSGVLAFFKEKYPEKVSVYTIFNPKTNEVFSKEICAGPHIQRTLGLGKFKIKKEESSGAGIRRIKAVLI